MFSETIFQKEVISTEKVEECICVDKVQHLLISFEFSSWIINEFHNVWNVYMFLLH
jgi:hypothetical protein